MSAETTYKDPIETAINDMKEQLPSCNLDYKIGIIRAIEAHEQTAYLRQIYYMLQRGNR